MQIQSDVSLLPFNTFGLDVHCRALVTLNSLADLPQLPALVRQYPLVLPLGGGSNMLFCEPFDGLVLLNRLKGIKVTQDEQSYLLEVGAGEGWTEFVDWTLAQGMGGLENLSLIPGTVGAAPIQNIGAYGLELKDRCQYVDYLDLQSGECHRLAADACQFGYRDSIFKGQLQGKVLITAVGLRLNKKWTPVLDYAPLSQLTYDGVTPRQVSELVKKVRRAKLPDPSQLGNAGSFYKNPTITKTSFEALKKVYADLPGYEVSPGQIKVPAAWFIDRAGWKGKRLGDAGVHEHQALVLVNHGRARAVDIVELARQIRDDVENKFGVCLSPEIRVIGASGEIPL